MQLSVEKMKSIGWIPEETSAEAVRAACRSSIKEICGEN
jgi:hypothetical protein